MLTSNIPYRGVHTAVLPQVSKPGLIPRLDTLLGVSLPRSTSSELIEARMVSGFSTIPVKICTLVFASIDSSGCLISMMGGKITCAGRTSSAKASKSVHDNKFMQAENQTR